ncbi:MAG: hypothetical protein A2268_06780 [Candidatus Raymondbacteria bacterium RifOxyA12_full_50_37]|uniref:Outer membrane lipoprotein BamD-like domain-containing protein n=1 Tax=Candidatus Raymondbacteria bacterium RIFOXYD12_FULL_49_13 TaxID=1817890 RepID=A0A1F7FL66_UNCRA|nr:MAG: hypothetical protein A2268_06780 [Candidatus Raymondbacteria bacterium RifOxyA12_full_50_37]OGJ88799.1 MAG: hypothetical protein A2248_08360 [Candidatus Raymondbacteria bacterium RIFOXYA2_FULL_49_16]OGJ96558.1 MAG: hypothetical protein A2453_03325 [Candidatus Raymondbacteria bacterium RIFOXYC2_FULL_50_21]OGJ99156.1 MAG: hypothetical protein A2487_10270 [Candidatus Raymondbacteria bacterium RifOxyC12_full_50_8]OGK04438.1 MAG: hypothetical protein A2350_17090 [Candidatus Raymondbacteria b
MLWRNFSRILPVLALLAPCGVQAALTPHAYALVIDSGIALTMNQEYTAVVSLLKAHAAKEPSNPLFMFYLMHVYQVMMIDYETTDFKREFDSCALAAEKGFLKRAASEANNPWINYYLGNIYVTQGAYELRFANYLNFSKNILKGVKQLKKAFEKDTTLYDACIYLGLFQYAKAELFGWVTFWEDDKDVAISLIEEASKKSRYSREVAEEILIGLYGHRGEREKASAAAARVKERFPGNRAVYWLMANIYLRNKQYAAAKTEFDALAPLVNQIPATYQYNYISLDTYRAKVAFELGDYGQCLALCDTVLGRQSGDERITPFKDIVRKLKKKSAERKMQP